MAIIRSFRELHVYRLAKMEAKRIFLLTKNFPAEEKYSLTDQIRRSSRAVNAMIVESWARRRYPAAFVNKLNEALGEVMETQAWLDHSLECQYITAEQHDDLDKACQHNGAMLNKMIQRSDDFCRTARVSKAED
jgi:four helix bundle protein